MEYVIETGGKQYRVAPGQKLKIEKIRLEPGQEIVFDKVLLAIDGDNVEIGTPYIADAKVTATLNQTARRRKVIVFRYHSKTRYRKKKGHRQAFSDITVKV